MDIKVTGGQTLKGKIIPSGSKNSAVALIPATILFDNKLTLENVPDITDVARLISILKKLGSKINFNKKTGKLSLDNSKLTVKNLNRDDLGNMRGTSLLWGPMLARFGKLEFSELPGGCTLGVRSLNPHYEAFADLGVTIKSTRTSVQMNASKAHAQEILLSEMSPTVTENVLMLATSLSGTTITKGAASEPQVQDLCLFLQKAGVKIEGTGSNVLKITTPKILVSPRAYRLFSDHYEITTFLALAAATGGKIEISDVDKHIFEPIDKVFKKFGLQIEYKNNKAVLDAQGGVKIKKVGPQGNLVIKAQPWPALPVDTLPLFIPIALAAKHGQVVFHNWMYESGLFWTSELLKLGANIVMADPHRVIVVAGNKLEGAMLEAPYIIRAVVAMVMAAMIAKGESTILNADALYRGHPHFAENLRKLGAKIKVIDKT